MHTLFLTLRKVLSPNLPWKLGSFKRYNLINLDFKKCNAINFFLNIVPILKKYLYLGLKKTNRKVVLSMRPNRRKIIS